MSARVRRVVVALESTVERVVTRLTLEVTANLVKTTPVDTGWARANWVPQIGTPYRPDVIDNAGDGAVNQRGGVQAAGIASIATYSYPGRVFISNNAPYIVRLNEGSSTQAPSGFVQAGIDRAIATVSGTTP